MPLKSTKFLNRIPVLKTFFTKGWHATVCKPVKTENWEDDLILLQGTPGLWGFMFCLSKIPELGDTYFIVLRKKKLIFLHWYHHITVMLYCFFQYANMIAAAQWFIIMNFFVHSVMYMYYAVTSLQIVRPPKWVNMLITSLQLFQMVVGIWVNVYIARNMYLDPNFYCDEMIETTYLFVNLAFVMYFSYFVLFVHFFYNTYFKSSRKSNNDLNRVQNSDAVSIENVDGRSEKPKTDVPSKKRCSDEGEEKAGAFHRKQLGDFMTTNGNAASANSITS
jgi:hypothetical protein